MSEQLTTLALFSAISLAILLGVIYVLLLTRLAQQTRSDRPAGGDLRLTLFTQVMDRNDAEISRLRTAKDIKSLYDIRGQLLEQLLVDACSVTGATAARVLRTINAYHKSNGAFDQKFGRLVETITVPDLVVEGADLRYFSLGDLSKEVRRLFPTHQSADTAATNESNKLIYATKAAKPSDPFLGRDAQSGILIPLTEGPYVVGLLSLEAQSADRFNAENNVLIDVCEQLAWMASDIIASAKVRLEDLQADALLNIYNEIMSMQRPDIDDFIAKIVQVATRLTARPCEWAQVLLIRHYPYDEDGQVQRVEKSYTMRLLEGGRLEISHARGLKFDEDYPTVTYPAFLRVIKHQGSHLNVDLQADREWKGRADIPWPNARSFVCVPLIRPLDDLGDKAPRVFGLLSLATSKPCSFNDSDDKVLNDFVKAIPLGIRNIELLEEASSLVGSLQHNLGKSIIPLYTEVSKEQPDWNVPRMRNLISLTRDLMRWSYDLSNEDDDLENTAEAQPIRADEILKELKDPMEILASVTSKRELVTQVKGNRPLTIRGGDQRRRYLSAALFLYIDNAFKYDRQHNIELEAAYEEYQGLPSVRFDVISQGTAIPLEQQPLLFKRGTRLDLSQDGEGIGLYQARRISVHLGGVAGYRFEPPNRNIFFIRLPWVG